VPQIIRLKYIVHHDKTKRGEIGGSYSTHGRSEKQKVFVGRPEEGKRRRRRILVNNNKTDLKEIEWGECGLDKSGSALGFCEHGN
jgi:hypothetical protein